VQHAVENGEIAVGRDDIDVVRLDLHAVLDLEDGHGGGALKQFNHDALVGRVEVLNDDEGEAAGGRDVLEELFQRLQSPGGSANADDGECAISAALHALRD